MTCDVLIIEDEVQIAELVELNLRIRGIVALVAQNGEDAIALSNSEKPLVVLLDIRLPDYDGWQVCRALKQGSSPPSIIFMTAAVQESDKRKAAEAGGDDFIEKPFDLSTLICVVKKNLALHK